MSENNIEWQHVRTEAAIYAEGTTCSTDELVAAYRNHVDREGDNATTCQRFFAKELEGREITETANVIDATILSLRDFWNSHDVKSIFVVGTGCPAGKLYVHNTEATDDEFCDINDTRDDLSPFVDMLALSGTADETTWTWDGHGSPRDVRGNSYLQIVVRAGS